MYYNCTVYVQLCMLCKKSIQFFMQQIFNDIVFVNESMYV